MVLVEGLDLAGVRIEPKHGGGVEVVAGMAVAGPRCGVADAPIDGLGVLVVVTGHPGGSAAGLPVIAFPGVMAGFTLARDGEGPPQFLAAAGVVRDDIAANAIFAARAADDDLAVDYQRHQGQVLTLLVVLDFGIPDHLAGFCVERDDVVVGGGEIKLVLPQSYAAAGRMQLKEIFGKLALVPPVILTGLYVAGRHIALQR